MISQMRIHHQKIAKVLREFPTQSDKWQMWLDYHEFQLHYFQRNRDNYVLAANTSALGMILAAGVASVSGDGNWWIAAGLMAAIWIGVEYYLYLYNGLMHALEEQTALLFEKTLAIGTKPSVAVGKYFWDIAGGVAAGWSHWWRARSKNGRQR